MEWIKVEDELPKVGQTCLILQTYPKGTMFNCRSDPLSRCFIKVGGLSYRGDFISYENQFPDEGIKYVTHWMPLPERPKD